MKKQEKHFWRSIISMIYIDFSEQEINELNYERYHYLHPQIINFINHHKKEDTSTVDSLRKFLIK